MIIQFTDKYQNTFSFTNRLDFFTWYYGFSQAGLESQFSRGEILKMYEIIFEDEEAVMTMAEILNMTIIRQAVKATQASY